MLISCTCVLTSLLEGRDTEYIMKTFIIPCTDSLPLSLGLPYCQLFVVITDCKVVSTRREVTDRNLPGRLMRIDSVWQRKKRQRLWTEKCNMYSSGVRKHSSQGKPKIKEPGSYLKVYGPITYGFIHRSGVFDIRWKPLFFSLRLWNFTCNRYCL